MLVKWYIRSDEIKSDHMCVCVCVCGGGGPNAVKPVFSGTRIERNPLVN